MTPIDPEVVRRKLGVITENLIRLEPIARLTLQEYLRDLFRRKGTERLLQELVEAAIDINTHLLAQQGRPVPDDAFSGFLALGEAGVLTKELAEVLAPAAGLRNRLVHEYDVVDDRLVLEAVRAAQKDMPRYVAAVEEWLRGIGG